MRIMGYMWTILLVSLSLQTYADGIENYRLSVDDQISVIIFNEPDMSVSDTRISTNGSISLPLIGQVQLKGKTVSEAEQIITEKLLDGYLRKPDVSVSISEYRPFYIKGEVNSPGGYPFRQGLTVERAVALAGGFTPRASKTTISVVSENQTREVKSVNLADAIQPGDVITIKESFF